MNFHSLTLLLLTATLSLARREDFVAMSNQVNAAQVGWVASLSSSFNFDDDASLTRLLGTLDTPTTAAAAPSATATTTITTTRPRLLATAYPASLDLRTKYPTCSSISLIRNQAACGSCWAVSAMNSLSDRYCIKKGTSRTFSPQDLMECCATCTGPAVAGVARNPCNGGYMAMGFDYAKNSGVSTGDDSNDLVGCKPYFLAAGIYSFLAPSTCHATCTNTKLAAYPVTNYRAKVDDYAIGTGADAMIAALNAGGSIAAQMTVYSDFYLYSSGIYKYSTGAALGGHGIRIVGYGTEAGVNYWIVANSWGAAWGEKGFFRIRRGTNECGIEKNPFMYGIFN